MNIITAWQAKTEQEQTALLLTNIKKAMREQIPASQRTMYEPHEFLGAAWERTNERFTSQYLNGTNDERAESGKEPITLITLVYRCCKDAVRSTVANERKHDHDELESEDGNTDGGYHGSIWQTDKRRTTEDRALIRVWLDELFSGLDERDAQIIKGKLNGMQQNELAEVIGISPAAICKCLKRIRATLTMTND